MLFKPLGTSRLQRLQGAYVSEEEVALVVEQCRSQRGQDLDESLLEAPEAAYEESDEDGDFDPDEDPLLDKAIEIVVQTQTASVSLLQRRLRVGYTRAGRLDRHARAAGDHLRLRGLQAAPRARLRERASHGLTAAGAVVFPAVGRPRYGLVKGPNLRLDQASNQGGRLTRKEGT